MEVFAIPKARIIEVIKANFGKVLCLREEPNASGSHQTYFYVARKLA